MTNTTTSASAILRPEQVAALLVQPTLAASIAATVCTVVTTGSATYRIPIIVADPTASWVAEGAEISPSDATLAEIDVVPAKVAGLSIISRELAEDSDPSAAAVVGAGLARNLAKRIDEAFFAGLPAPAPAGLPSITPGAVVEPGAAFTSLDSFAAALSAAEQVGAIISAFVTSPAEALALAKLKVATGSNQPLLGVDPTSPTSRSIFGVPLYVSQYVQPKMVWGIPADRTFLVVRSDAKIEADASPFFTSDRIAVKGTLRAAFGLPHPAALIKISHG